MATNPKTNIYKHKVSGAEMAATAEVFAKLDPKIKNKYTLHKKGVKVEAPPEAKPNEKADADKN